MNRRELEERTKKFALRVIGASKQLERSLSNDVIGRQLLKAGTSVGANYREAARAQSRSDFIHKIAICEKELSEAAYWVEILGDAEELPPDITAGLLEEADELLRIFVASSRTAKRNAAVEKERMKIRESDSQGKSPGEAFYDPAADLSDTLD